jgi:hypothetical protein
MFSQYFDVRRLALRYDIKPIWGGWQDADRLTLLIWIPLSEPTITRYFAHYDYFDRAESSVSQVGRQRQRGQAPHVSQSLILWLSAPSEVRNEFSSNLVTVTLAS